ncbi:hypothetical protein KM043_016419 [Ampulex compressa]|nr:hypothetical protein KM043_016419 [Ampulex compressa]
MTTAAGPPGFRAFLARRNRFEASPTDFHGPRADRGRIKPGIVTVLLPPAVIPFVGIGQTKPIVTACTCALSMTITIPRASAASSSGFEVDPFRAREHPLNWAA